MRLYDQISTLPDWHRYLTQLLGDEGTHSIELALRQAVVIVADNVAQYYFSGTDQETWDLTTDFPNVAPPFARFWIEYRYPRLIVSEVTGASRTPRELHELTVGALVTSLDLQENTKPPPHIGANTRWQVEGILLSSKRGTPDYIGAFQWQVDSEGHIALDGNGRLSYGVGIPLHAQRHVEKTSQFITEVIAPMMLAITFMHCQNVRFTVQSPPAGLSRKWQRKTGQPLTRYRLLEIGPVREILTHEGQRDQVGLKRALHVCRGHFKHYTDKGLFGKYQGTYWWPPHMRGTKESGEVIKRYDVQPTSNSSKQEC
jgi:hypothetical protein